MNITKIFLIVITFIGIGLMVFGVSINIELDKHVFFSSSDRFQNYVWGGAFIFIASGALLSFIGVMLARLHYFGIPLIILGLVSDLSFIGMYFQFYMPVPVPPHLRGLIPGEFLPSDPGSMLIHNLYFLVPGIMCIIGGILGHIRKPIKHILTKV